MADGFLQPLIEGFMSTYAPGYFNAMKQQQAKEAEDAANMAQLDDMAKQVGGIYDPLIASTQDPNRAAQLRFAKSLAMSRNMLLAKNPDRMAELAFQHGLMATDPTEKMKEATYSYNDAIPQEQRQMVYQRAMKETPADIQERAIKQQNADTLARNAGTAKQNADTNQFYRKNQVEQATSPDVKPNKLLMPPAKISDGYIKNKSTIAEIEKAIQAAKDNPGAFGIQNYAAITQPTQDIKDVFTSSKDTETVTRVGGIKSLKKHDISGAAVPIGEAFDLRHLPNVTADKDTVVTKLEVILDNIKETQKQIEDTYSETNGFNPILKSDNKTTEQEFKYSDSGQERYDPVNKTLESKVGNKWVKIYDNVIVNDDGSISTSDKVDEEVKPDIEEDLNIDDLVNKYKTKSK